MNMLGSHEEEDDHGEVFLDEADIINEIPVDEEGLSFLPLSLPKGFCEVCFTNYCVYFVDLRSS